MLQSPREDRWSAKPRLGLVLNIAIRHRDLAPLGLPSLAAVISLLLDMDPQKRQRRSGTGTYVGRLCNWYLVTWPWGLGRFSAPKNETTTRPFRSIFESICPEPQMIRCEPVTAATAHGARIYGARGRGSAR